MVSKLAKRLYMSPLKYHERASVLRLRHIISDVRSAALIAVCAFVLADASAAEAADEPSIAIEARLRYLWDIGIQPSARSAAASTTFLAYFTFDSGPNCVYENWVSVDLTAGTEDFGDYAGLFPALTVAQQDPCAFEWDCVWTFFAGSTDDYTCGGYPSQPIVPYGSAGQGYIHNEIWSPAIALSGRGSQLEMRFHVYRELNLDDLVFYTWRVRSVVSGEPGEWTDRNTIYYGPNAVIHTSDWYRHVVSFGDLVDPGADSIQVALGVVDMCGDWCGVLGDGLCHSHTPLFDDIELFLVDVSGPSGTSIPSICSKTTSQPTAPAPAPSASTSPATFCRAPRCPSSQATRWWCGSASPLLDSIFTQRAFPRAAPRCTCTFSTFHPPNRAQR